MKKIIGALGLFAVLAGCGGSDDGNSGGTGGNTDASVLSAPVNNAECLTGTDISATQNKVTFQWAASPDTDKYFIYIKDLNSQSVSQYSAGTATTYDATLTKGTPYSWYVSSKKSTGTSVNSAVWKFYNAGTPTSSHAPFPADVVAPAMTSVTTGTTTTLQWAGSDIDGDIANYKVYLDATANPATLVGTVTAQKLDNVAITTGVNYWKVVTTDSKGNSSTSPVYQFKVN